MRDDYDFDEADSNFYSIRLKDYGSTLAAWQLKEIKQALKEADAEEFSSDKDLAKAIKKYVI